MLFFILQSVTSNLCYDIISLIKSSFTALETSKDPQMISMAFNMMDKFDKYQESMGKINKMLIVASIFYPWAKIHFAQHIFQIIFANDSSKIEEMTTTMNDLLNDRYDIDYALYSTPPLYGKSIPSGIMVQVFLHLLQLRLVSWRLLVMITLFEFHEGYFFSLLKIGKTD